jgi:hypothetical protein
MYNNLESFLLQLGFSWTAAKFVPYFLTLIIGFVFFKLLAKVTVKNWLRLIFMALGFCLPFLTYFTFFPIYKADLQAETYTPPIVDPQLPNQATLFIVILPGCPYCMETIQLSKQMLQKNSKIRIQYLLTSEDMEGYRYFRKRLPKQIGVKIPANPTIWMLSAAGEFPSYLLVKDRKVVKAWHNNEFGVRALDQINAYF